MLDSADQQALNELASAIDTPLPVWSAERDFVAKLGYFAEAGRVRSLSLRGCRLTTIPEALWRLTDLRVLLLGENPLGAVPDRFDALPHLTELYLHNSELTALPESLGSLSHLQILDLGHNALTEIPAALAQLTGLRFLYLSDNRLSALPELLLADLRDLCYLGRHR